MNDFAIKEQNLNEVSPVQAKLSQPIFCTSFYHSLAKIAMKCDSNKMTGLTS